jgi:hypothetical protein
MTEPNDAEVGKIMREHKQTLAAIAKLDADAREIGSWLSAIGGLLARTPQNLYLRQEDVLGTADTPPRTTYKCSDREVAKIHALCEDYRKRLKEKFEFEDRLKELGYPVPLG